MKPSKKGTTRFLRSRGLTTLLLLLSACLVHGQEQKDLRLSIATGFLTTGHYVNVKPRQFYNFSFDYSVRKRHILSADFLSGRFRYYDSIRVSSPIPLSTPGYEHHANADARYTIFSVLYKYRLLDRKKIFVNIGSGLGLISETFIYPVDLANGGFTFETATGGTADLCFPVRLDAGYQLSGKLQIGVMAGTYVYPDYPLVGQHLGIQLSYVIK